MIGTIEINAHGADRLGLITGIICPILYVDEWAGVEFVHEGKALWAKPGEFILYDMPTIQTDDYDVPIYEFVPGSERTEPPDMVLDEVVDYLWSGQGLT